MSLGDGVTWADWARLVAAEVGVYGLDGPTVGRLLWERTAWPITMDVAILRPQLVAALVGPQLCPCCGGRLGTDGYMGVCLRCAQGHGWERETAPD